MRLLSRWSDQHAAVRAAVVDGELAIDLAHAGDVRGADGHVGPSLKALLSAGREALEERVIDARRRALTGGAEVTSLDALHALPPIPNPDKIICLGLNYSEHADEFGADEPSEPILFAKFRNALTGSGAPVPCLPGQQLDYEGELAVVIGRTCRDASPGEALEYVAGVMPFNDVTDRELQFRTGQWMSGKMLDGFAPCGPHLVTLEEIEDIQGLAITTRLNGTVVQHGSTSQMIFSVRKTIAYLSALATLSPGDIVATGTPSGIGFKREPPIFLSDGDTVEVEISGVGTLRNPVAMRSDLPAVSA
jgi:2-keto-4-pentenoate hydratase/2-oxohepta-3-ene-1,7-dioic acid hydratase in catechol pathway